MGWKAKRIKGLDANIESCIKLLVKTLVYLEVQESPKAIARTETEINRLKKLIIEYDRKIKKIQTTGNFA